MAPLRPQRYLGQAVARRFIIDRLVGEGSFAWVYHACDGAGHEAAVKVLHSAQRSATLRFAREVRVVQALSPHPSVARYIDHGATGDGRPLLVLEYVDGITLKQGLERRPSLPPAKAVAFVAELCRAFAGLHELGVAHRDVKPENILLGRSGDIKLIDFGLIRDAQGILKLIEEEGPVDSRVFAEDLDSGVLAGTPEYMAPEQFSDSAVEDETDTRTDTWSDVFSLGVILCELLTGRTPFPMRRVSRPDHARELLRYYRWRIALQDGDVTLSGDLDPQLASIVRKALRRDPRQRQPESRTLMHDLLHYLETGQGVLTVDESRTVVVTPGYPSGTIPPIANDPTALTDVEANGAAASTSSATARFAATALGESRVGLAEPFFATKDPVPQRPAPETAVDPRGTTVAFVRPDSTPADDQLPVENLADPPRRGEPDVPSAPTDLPGLGEEDLFGESGPSEVVDDLGLPTDETGSDEVNLADAEGGPPREE
jgi:serine/threonine-protein kinase